MEEMKMKIEKILMDQNLVRKQIGLNEEKNIGV